MSQQRFDVSAEGGVVDQVTAVRQFIKTVRTALDQPEEAFSDGAATTMGGAS